MPSRTSALSSRNFLIYLSGSVVSLHGLWIYRVALGWFAWQLTHSEFWVGVVAFTHGFGGRGVPGGARGFLTFSNPRTVGFRRQGAEWPAFSPAIKAVPSASSCRIPDLSLSAAADWSTPPSFAIFFATETRLHMHHFNQQIAVCTPKLLRDVTPKIGAAK